MRKFFKVGLATLAIFWWSANLQAQEKSITNDNQKSTAVNIYGFKGNCVEIPEFGFNNRPTLSQPYNQVNVFTDPVLLDMYSEMHIKHLRFPGGTFANNYNWLPYRMNTIGERVYSSVTGPPIPFDEQLHPIEIQEGSFLRVSRIGCLSNCNAVAGPCSIPGSIPNDIYSQYEYLLNSPPPGGFADFKSAIDQIGAKPIYVLSMIDPFTFYTSGNVNQAKLAIANQVGANIKRQLIKILSEYQDLSNCNYDYNDLSSFDLYDAATCKTDCNGCVYIGDDISFELGNEFYFNKYAKFFPSAGCLNTTDCKSGCNDNQCYVDPMFYAQMADGIVDLIRSKFPNAKIAVIGGNRNKVDQNAGLDWTEVVMEKLNDLNTDYDAITIHNYTADIPDTLNGNPLPEEPCHETSIAVNIQNNFKAEDSKDIDQLLQTYGKEVWITEFNLKSPEDQGDGNISGLNPDLALNWSNTLLFSDVINSHLYRLPGHNAPGFEDFLNGAGEYPITRMLAQRLNANEGQIEAGIFFDTNDDKPKLSAFGIGMKLWAMMAENATKVRPVFFSEFNTPGITVDNSFTCELNILPNNFCNNLVVTNTYPKVYGWEFDNGKVLLVNQSDITVNLVNNGNFDPSPTANLTQFTGSPIDPVAAPAPCFLDLVEDPNCTSDPLNEPTNVFVNRSGSIASIPPKSISIFQMRTTAYNCINVLNEIGSSNLQVQNEGKLELYPNPVDNQINVVITESTGKEQITYRMINLQGIQIAGGIWTGTGTQTIHTASFPNGVYILQTTHGNKTTTNKIVINH